MASVGGGPGRGGVSAFGVGGTNAHVILEEAPARPPFVSAPAPRLLLLSARSPAALDATSRAIADRLREEAPPALDDVAFTLHAGRRHFAFRRAVVASDAKTAASLLAVTKESVAPAAVTERRLVFLFPGQGAQYAAMGSSLYRAEPVFREHLDECARAWREPLGCDLRDVLYPKSGGPEEWAATLRETRYTQPALFAVELALARLLESWGLTPSAMVGHSIGEFVCAVLSGVMRIEDALALVVARGTWMFDLPPGAMLSVRAPANTIAQRLPPDLAIASDNAPCLCVVSGPSDSVAALRVQLESEGIACRPLQTSHAFHSPMMAPMVEPFTERVATVALSAPRIPFVSTLTGRFITEEQARNPSYWGRHLLETVRFSGAVATLGEGPPSVMLEVGPRSTLATLVRQQLKDRGRHIAIPTLGEEPRVEREALLSALGQAWTNGMPLAARALHGEQARRVPLPTYPFERTRFWIDPAPRGTEAAVPAKPNTNGAARHAVDDLKEEPTVIVTSRSRVARLSSELRQVFESASGVEIGESEVDRSFVELGLDSLFLTQAALAVGKKTGVKVTFRQLVENLTTIRLLAEHIDGALPPEDDAPPQAASFARAAAGDRQTEPGSHVPPAPERASPAPTVPPKPFGAMARITLEPAGTRISPKERARLDALTRRYTARTKASKEWTQEHRATMADPRVVTGFRPAIKELVYPIVIERSAGSRLWDLDGNEYVDCLNGFGCNLFGWQPEIVSRAVERQLRTGHEIGPQTPLAGECAKLVCELTGFDRAAFCNTGSEAVLGTMRIARTVTGRSKIALFSGSYHGIFDEVIVRATKSGAAVPAAPGILPETAENVVVLEYGADASLVSLRAQASELAAVLVEPVQSRRPELQPREFLHELRKLTEEAGTTLIFDEVITGFRTCPGGAQEHFGIRADLASYGKVIGGGMPVGVIAGKRAFMDALDGGYWEFGDASGPTVGVTYFAGTFVRHPMALAAVKAVLTHLKAEGPALQRETNAKVERLARELNAFFDAVGAPIAIRHFGSLWRTAFTSDQPWGDLLFVLLRDRGIHILDGFPCFFTTAHTAADVDAVIAAFKAAVIEMQESAFLPEGKAKAEPSAVSLDASAPPLPGARLGCDLEGRPAWFVPNPNEPGKYLKL